ncbi:MAG TPA: hypothetical protein VKA54_16970 [Gemmatimonadaceae bacterium]|nr:hypothetical protein [Gemmatimonadaceae bacterium]
MISPAPARASARRSRSAAARHRSGRATVLEEDYEHSVSHPNYDVAPDGAQLLMLEPAGGGRQVVVVHGWVRELLAATGGR